MAVPFIDTLDPAYDLDLHAVHKAAREQHWYARTPVGIIVLRYRDDVNGALGNVAGVVNEARNVMGLMPHPEHAVDPLLGSADGGLLLAALADAAARHRALAPA